MILPAEVFKRVLEVLDRLKVKYYVGGSGASSAHGIPRPTIDIDIVVDLPDHLVNDFVEALKGDFYTDGDQVRECRRRGRSFNLIHFATSYKFDLFPLLNDAYSQLEFARRQYIESDQFGEPIEFAVATPEDTILSKLKWYRAGGETSERQWNDVRGIVQIRGDELDREYLRHWGEYLKVADLVEKVLTSVLPVGEQRHQEHE
jgi:hypothetical protein